MTSFALTSSEELVNAFGRFPPRFGITWVLAFCIQVTAWLESTLSLASAKQSYSASILSGFDGTLFSGFSLTPWT